jgi:uncharacterized protein YutD
MYERQRDIVLAFQNKFAVPEECHIIFDSQRTAAHIIECEFYREMIYNQLRHMNFDPNSDTGNTSSKLISSLLTLVIYFCIWGYAFRLLHKILQELRLFNYNRREGGGSL